MSDGTAGTGVYTYEWTLNGKGAVTTETYEVPADAKSGDKIKVTVTDELGNTAEDTVYVGGFTITKVEPTTATTATTTTGYKYIRAYFSSSLATLTADDIEIRDKDTEQLYSVDTVKLSSDGTYADITLFGSQDEGATSFLIPQTIYTMEIANSQGSDIFEFELPMIDSDVLVTAVDIEKGKLFFGGTTGFEVGDVYDGNLGTLVGRRVNVGVNSDNEIEKLSVKKANVVYGVMKYNDKEDGTELTGAISDKDYFEDQVTKTKYYMTSWASATTTIKASSIRRVVDGTSIGDGTDALADVTYKYTKLVLNSNGTVDCAVVDPEAWDGVIKVADVDGTIVSETTKVNVDFDSYTIEKAGEYVTTADLEEDDIVFYDSTGDQKFAEVYNAVVEGEPSDIDSTSIAIDDEAYKWTYKDIITETTVSANYYNTDDDVYEPLLDLGDDVKAQKYLNSLDAEIGVTAYLDRLGNIAYIDGIPSESAVTTDTWYVTTSAGAGYTQALTSYLKFKVSDGTEKTIEIPVDQIKKFNGEKVAISGGTNTSPAADGSDYEFNVDFDDDDPTDYTDVEAQNLIESGVLVKLTTDEDGKIIGITFGGDYSNAETDDYEVVDTIDGKDSNALKPGASKVTTDGGFSAKLTDDTIIWVYTTDQTDSNKITVTKETFADYTRKTDKISVLNAVQADPFDDAAIVGPYVLISGSSVTDVLLRETLDNKDAVKTSNTFVEGDTNSTEGIITAYTTKVNAAGDANYVNTVTVLGLDGTKTTYTALKEGALDDVVGKDVYVSLDLDKTTGNAANVTEYGWTRTSGVDAATSSATEIKTLDGYTVKIDSDAQVLKKTDSGYETIKLNQIAASTKDLQVSWHDQYFNAEKVEHYADFVVVKEVDNAEGAAIAALKADALVAIAAANSRYTNLLAGEATMSAYEADDKAADNAINAWATLSELTASEATLGTTWTTFNANATAYEGAKTAIDTKLSSLGTLTLADSNPSTQEGWVDQVKTAIGMDGYTIAVTVTSPTSGEATLTTGAANTATIKISKAGYENTKTGITITNGSF